MSSNRWKAILVVVTDPFAREQLAATKAAAIARRSGARVTLFNSFMIPQPVCDVPMDSQQQIIASAIRQRRERMHKLASSLRLSAPVQCIVHWDYPAHEAIVRQVLAQEPDIVVTESHRHGRFARLVLANTDWELIRSCPCPVWFVRSPELPRSPRFLVAVDPRHAHAKPTRLDDRLLQATRSLTDQLEGRISVVHAFETPVSAMPGMLMEPVRLPIAPERTREFVAKTTQSVQRLAQKYGISSAECFIDEGSPANVIAATVYQAKTDVLVMGAVSRSMLLRPVIGNTAERVIDQVDCDVFVVKPAGFKPPVRLTRPKTTSARSSARGEQSDRIPGAT
jgi:universal stress protein E